MCVAWVKTQKFSNSGDSNHFSLANEEKQEKKLSEEACAKVDEEIFIKSTIFITSDYI